MLSRVAAAAKGTRLLRPRRLDPRRSSTWITSSASASAAPSPHARSSSRIGSRRRAVAARDRQDARRQGRSSTPASSRRLRSDAVGDLLREARRHERRRPRPPRPGRSTRRAPARLDPDVYLATSDAEVDARELRARTGGRRQLRAVRDGRFARDRRRLLEPGPEIGEALDESPACSTRCVSLSSTPSPSTVRDARRRSRPDRGADGGARRHAGEPVARGGRRGVRGRGAVLPAAGARRRDTGASRGFAAMHARLPRRAGAGDRGRRRSSTTSSARSSTSFRAPSKTVAVAARARAPTRSRGELGRLAPRAPRALGPSPYFVHRRHLGLGRRGEAGAQRSSTSRSPPRRPGRAGAPRRRRAARRGGSAAAGMRFLPAPLATAFAGGRERRAESGHWSPEARRLARLSSSRSPRSRTRRARPAAPPLRRALQYPTAVFALVVRVHDDARARRHDLARAAARGAGPPPTCPDRSARSGSPSSSSSRRTRRPDRRPVRQPREGAWPDAGDATRRGRRRSRSASSSSWEWRRASELMFTRARLPGARAVRALGGDPPGVGLAFALVHGLVSGFMILFFFGAALSVAASETGATYPGMASIAVRRDRARPGRDDLERALYPAPRAPIALPSSSSRSRPPPHRRRSGRRRRPGGDAEGAEGDAVQPPDRVRRADDAAAPGIRVRLLRGARLVAVRPLRGDGTFRIPVKIANPGPFHVQVAQLRVGDVTVSCTRSSGSP